MLSYRHCFHAGNFADVHKHTVLTLLLERLIGKDKPFCYHDTHAGAGRYNLKGLEINKHAEYRAGIQRIWAHRNTSPSLLIPYFQAIQACNTPQRLHCYPGSPRIARHFLRPRDRMVLTELHSTDIQTLEREFSGDRAVAIHHLDAYQGLKALLPPREKRGVVFIDPPFERRGEMERMTEAVAQAMRRWAHGIYALWHPITNRTSLEKFYKRLERSGLRKILVSELYVHPPITARQLNGSCMAIVNPPWLLHDHLQQTMPWLEQGLVQEERAASRTHWLVPE